MSKSTKVVPNVNVLLDEEFTPYHPIPSTNSKSTAKEAIPMVIQDSVLLDEVVINTHIEISAENILMSDSRVVSTNSLKTFEKSFVTFENSVETFDDKSNQSLSTFQVENELPVADKSKSLDYINCMKVITRISDKEIVRLYTTTEYQSHSWVLSAIQKYTLHTVVLCITDRYNTLNGKVNVGVNTNSNDGSVTENKGDTTMEVLDTSSYVLPVLDNNTDDMINAELQLLKERSAMKDLGRVKRALVIINGYTMVKRLGVDAFGIPNNPMSMHVYMVMKEMVYKYLVVAKKDGLSYASKIYDSVLNHCSINVLKVYKEAFKYFRNAELKFINSETKTYYNDKEIKDLVVTLTGLSYTMTKNLVINGYTINTNVSVSANSMVIKHGLFDCLVNTNIHSYTTVLHNDNTESLIFEDSAIMFGTSLFAKLGLIVNKGISLDSMYLHPDYKLVLKLKEDTINTLDYISVPGIVIPNVYYKTGMIAARHAKFGMVAPLVTIPGFIEVNNHTVTSREALNKTLARYEKMESVTEGWVLPELQQFLLIDIDSVEITDEVLAKCGNLINPTRTNLQEYLVAGLIYMPTNWLLKYGHCRVTATMENGCVKATTSMVSMIDKDLDQANIGLIGGNSWKGGLLSLQESSDTNNMLNHLVNNPDVVAAINSDVSTWDDYTILGQKVKGIMVNVQLRISNAYSAELFKIANKFEPESEVEDLHDLGEKLVADELDLKVDLGLRGSIMDYIINDNGNIIDFIKHNLEANSIKRKKLITRFIAPELQSIAYWYSKETAVNLVENLLTNRYNKDHISKKYATQWLTGTASDYVVTKVTIQQLINVYVTHMSKDNQILKAKGKTYSVELVMDLLNLLGGFEHKSGWIQIDYGFNQYAYLPANSILHNYINEEIKEWDTNIVVSGLLLDFIGNIVKCITTEGKLFNNEEMLIDVASYLNACVERELLGKELGRLYTKGQYMIIMVCPFLKIDEMVVLSRDDYSNYKGKGPVYVNGTKMPNLFDKATAGFKCYSDFNCIKGHEYLADTTDEMKTIMSNVVFMSVEAILKWLNDADGDAFRVSFDKFVLPFLGSVGTTLDQFNGQFFIDSINKEYDGLKLKAKVPTINYIGDIHQALSDTIQAKDNVALYSSMKFGYEYALHNIDTVKGINGKDITVTHQDKLDYSLLFGELVQAFGMNVIKQSTKENVQCVADVLGYTNFAYACNKSELRLAIDHAVGMTYEYVKQYGKSLDWCIKFVNVLAAVSKSLKPDNSFVYGLFNDRVTNNYFEQGQHRYGTLTKEFPVDTNVSMYHYLYSSFVSTYLK